jgi:hypothetical protein
MPPAPSFDAMTNFPNREPWGAEAISGGMTGTVGREEGRRVGCVEDISG